jgi:hypothetical protein
VVSVLADRVYYLHRRRADGANLGSIALEPGGYAASVRAVVEAVLENSEPGPVRERAVRRILREEILGRLDGPEFLAATATFRTALVAALGEVVGRMVDPAVDEELGAVARRRARLLRDGDVDGLVDLAGWSQDVRGTVDLRSLVWRRGRLVMALSARLVDGTGRPVAPGSIARGRAMVAPGTDGSAAGVSHVGPAAATTIQVYLRDPVTGAEWLANTRAEDGAADSSDGTVDAVARFDPLQVAGGRPLASGRWDVVVRLAAEGLDRRVRPRLTEPGAALPGPVAALLGPTPVAVEVRLDEEGGVGIEVGVTELELGDAEGRGLLHEAGDGREIRVVLPVAGGGSPGGWTAQVVVATPAGERTAAAHLRPRGGRIALVARVERSQKLPPGSHALALRLPGSGLRDMPLGSVTVSRRGQVHVVGSPRLGSAQRFGRTVRRAIRAVRRTLRSLTAA